jgi:hypothetical protein
MSILVLGLSGSQLSAQVSSLQRIGGGGGPAIPKKGKVVEFRVSVAGKDKTELMRVFAAVQKQEESKGITEFLVIQRIGKRDFLVYEKDETNQYGAKIYSRRTVFWLKTKQDHDVADNEELTNIIAAPTGKTREYTSAIGVKNTVRELEETAALPKFLKEDFLAGRIQTVREYLEEG